MIELIEVDEEARRQLFDRLNSGGTQLKDMEQRFGSRDGRFMDLIRQVASDQRFRQLCPISPVRVKHREYEEMILRFYAYRNRYEQFNKRVDDFLDDYLDSMNRNDFDQAECTTLFNQMLDFVERYFPDHFRKGPTNSSVPRIRFEAISVGVSLALHIDPNLVPANMAWLSSEEFQKLTRSDASNSRPKVINRIHFVRDNLLGRQPIYASEEA
jgi:AcrR family transcriptional regulator